MLTPAANPLMFALFSFGNGELVLVLALIVILFVVKNLRGLARGLGEGFFHFRKATGDVQKELNQAARDAGASLGGIYGKPAFQALTPDNQTSELYDPAVFRNSRNKKRKRFRGLLRLWRLLRRFVFNRVHP